MIQRLAASWLPLLSAHVVESTLFLAIVLTTILALRNRLTAGTRCALALIGIVKFAIPSAPLRLLIPAKSVALTIAAPAVRILSYPSRPVGVSVWPVIVLALWLAVALLVIGRVALIRHRLVAIATRTAAPPDPREIAALARARRRVPIRSSVDLIRSALPEAPAVLRVLRPLIVLPPQGCDALADDEIESLLCHELAHVARYDNIAARIESFICAFFWFHPLIWIAQRITARERERACDEVVAGSADQRETYLTALRKFCHAAIAPRLPGVSCMATANLKERIDHMVRFPSLKPRMLSAARMTLTATAALAIFTAAAAVLASGSAFARDAQDGNKPFSLRLRSTADAAGIITLHIAITDNATHDVLATPTVKLDAGRPTSARTVVDDYIIDANVTPADNRRSNLTVTITKNGQEIQRTSTVIEPRSNDTPRVYTGEKISLNLHDADLRDVLNTFGKLTGLQMKIDSDVQGKVTVQWHDVPWDEAFDDLVKDNGLTWTVRDNVAHVSKK